MRVRFVASDPFGGGNLRSFWPAEALTSSGIEARSEMWLPMVQQDEYDVIVLHRPLFVQYPDRVKKYQAKGIKVLIDEDDDLTRIDQTKNEIGLQEWVPMAVMAHDRAMYLADGITVSTPALADVYSKLNPNVTVCRNYLPKRMLPIRNPDPRHRWPKGAVRVGWQGITMTHRHDLEWIAPEAPRMLRDAEFVTVGDRETPRVLGFRGAARVDEFQSDAKALYKIMAKADIGIVPLLPCEFNEAKSALKAIENMTLGIPVVVTDLPEQREFVTHGVDGFLAATPAEFADYVQLLVHDHALRQTMGLAAAAKAATLSIEDHVEGWMSAFASVVPEGAVA